jgi:hypothetical protein
MQTVLPSAHSEPLGAVTCVALSSDERHLFAGLASGQLLAVSTTTGSVIASLEVGDGPIDTVAEIILGPNGDSNRGFAAVEEDGGVPAGEAFAAWKVLVVAAGGEVHFFRGGSGLRSGFWINVKLKVLGFPVMKGRERGLTLAELARQVLF